jgi:hypothetical protein
MQSSGAVPLPNSSAAMVGRHAGWSFRLLVFLASFLMFQIELLIAKRLLPHFGSSATVWTTSLVFFQLALLVGYVLAARVARSAARGNYRFLHVAFVGLSALVFPFRLVVVDGPPALSVMLALALSVGLPFVALSTTSIVAQSWFTRTDNPARDDPYFLYGTSNAGAVSSLLCYPLLVEPLLDLGVQQGIWYAFYGIYALLHVACLKSVAARSSREAAEPKASSVVPTRGRVALWVLLSAAANAFLMAVTNVVTADAPLPLLWVLPLTLYLLTLVICFARRIPSQATFDALGVLGLGVAAVALVFVLHESHLQLAYIVLHASSLWVGCIILNRNLARAKPEDPRELGGYYLAISAGGVLGAMGIGLLMPVLCRNVSTAYVDYAAAGLLMVAALLTRDAVALRAFAKRRPKSALAAVLAAGGMGLVLIAAGVAHERAKVHGSRTFYGLYSVIDKEGLRWFFHGNTVHGIANLAKGKRSEPLAYFHAESPVGRVLESPLPRRRVGLVGLGVGTLTAYGRPGDHWDVFELDGEVEAIARRHFEFLSTARAATTVTVGDARLTLAKVPDRSYELLILDAFSSDYVPTHLLTREAIELYLRKLEPHGLLLCHISNRIFDLRPVLVRLAAEFSLSPTWLGAVSPELGKEGKRQSLWFALARTPAEHELMRKLRWRDATPTPDLLARRVWSDDYVNLFHALR